MSSLTLAEVQAIQAKVNTGVYQRWRVLHALQEVLKTITKTNGYEYSVDDVLFEVNDARSRSSGRTPVIYVVDGRQREIRHAGLPREVTWTVYLYIVVRGHKIEDLENFIGDTEQCLFDNNTLVGNVARVEIPNIITDQQLFNKNEGVFQAEMELELHYIRCARTVK